MNSLRVILCEKTGEIVQLIADWTVVSVVPQPPTLRWPFTRCGFYREALAKAGAVEDLLDMFDAFLKDKGYLAMGGQIVDATIVTAPRQHNKREENETIKAGETPKDWKDKPAKDRQKDKDARWTKKHGRQPTSKLKVS
jgi:hypothetical protein